MSMWPRRLRTSHPAALAVLSLTVAALTPVTLPSVSAAVLSGDAIQTNAGELIVHPIEHATFIMSWNGKTILVDPVGGAGKFRGLPKADMILITDVHYDHLDIKTLNAVAGRAASIVAPKAVTDQLPRKLRDRATPLANGQTLLSSGLEITAIPMYNLTAERLQFHDKGRGNGYVIDMGGKRVYISGDTEDIPEMRQLRNIDVAFVCMNLPYTMTEEQAASAVREFKPGIVYPYHYRGKDMISDVGKFRQQVSADSSIDVRLRDWYPQ